MAITTQNPNLTPQQPNAAQTNYDYQWYQTQTNITSINANLNTLQTQLTTLATFGSNIQSVGTANTAGNDTVACADNHTHIGVTSLNFTAAESGPLTLAGNCVVQATTTFSFFTFGAIKLVAPSYSILTTDSFLVVTPTAGGQTITLPKASTMTANWTLRVHNGSSTTGFTIDTHAGDLFNAIAGQATYAINSLGSTSYIGTILVCDGVSNWYSAGYN